MSIRAGIKKRDRREAAAGQAVVEYILMLVLVVSVVLGIAYGFKSSILTLWQSFTQDVTAACPRDCPKNSSYQFP